MSGLPLFLVTACMNCSVLYRLLSPVNYISSYAGCEEHKLFVI